MKSLRFHHLFTILIALLTLLALSGAAYAIGRSLGYIPGLGVVDQSAPLRVLVEPISQTQDGITITVKDAIASADKTIVAYVIENIPPENLSPAEDVPCPNWPQLQLPDGTLYELKEGDGNIHEMRLIYAPLPADVRNATLLIPCIQGAEPVTLPLPENWKLPLRFITVSQDLTVLPVIEVTPSSISETDAALKNPMSITKIIDTGDNYILIGEFQPPPPQPNESDSGAIGLRVTDGNRQDILFEGFPQDTSMPTPISPTAETWAVKFSKDFVPPVHIIYAKQYILTNPSSEAVEFEFDAGENPQIVRTWQMNKEFTLAGHKFILDSIVASPSNFYKFNFTSTDQSIYSVDVMIDDYPPDGVGGGMDADMVGMSGGVWSMPVGPYRELPKGRLKVTLSHLWYLGETKEWTIDWQP